MRSFLHAIFISVCLLTSPFIEAAGSSHAVATSTEFLGPTERFLIANPLDKIKPHLKAMGIKESHVKIINQAIAEETLGFFGYHGARREFLIFQDIIRYGIEEILGIPIRADFHFLRIPGHPKLNVDSISEFFAKHPGGINDNLPIERLQLLSMNTALYSPYQEPWELSLNYFTKNANISKHDYEEVLIPFFLMLGIDPVYIPEAFKIAEAMLTRKSGVLIQFFDTSLYELADQQAYFSLVRGERLLPNDPISQLLLDINQTKFPQSRLVLNNRNTLNPYSSLSMKRYTLTSSDEFAAYQNALRKYFQSLPFDEFQKENYRAQLLSLWEQ